MKPQSVILALAMLAFGYVSPLAQSDEIKLDPAQSKITTVSAMRVRKAPQITADEVMRLKLGTVVSVVTRSTDQAPVGDKTDYWYRINLPNGQTGWLFGGLLLDYAASRRQELLRQIIEARLKAENTDFPDRQEIYNLAASSVKEAKDINTRAEFELLQHLALAGWARSFRDDLQDKSPYREWLKAHAAEVIPNEFGGAYNLRSELIWNLEKKYHALPVADRIAWEAAQNPQPSDCEGDEVCHFFIAEGAIKYLGLHPNGTHATEALKYLTESLTDEVIRRANDKGGDKYAVEERTALRKKLATLRLVLAKTSAPERAELLNKLRRITPGS
ncbi:MAG TPA: SH3 domain-containing protein [Pyrinomonadaceae bacterium]|nr:SH3 domain-containing protein [Pyrinomonadaceae bacterium]